MIKLTDPPVVNPDNGTLKIPAKVIVGLFLVALGEMWTWRLGTEGDRYRLSEAVRDNKILQTEISQLKTEIVDIHQAMAELPPDEWRQRILELEKWRYKHLGEDHKQ